MKNNPLFLLLILLAILFNGCGNFGKYFTDKPDIYIKGSEELTHIAVLNFTRSGSFLSKSTESIAADKLSDALFLKGKFDIIDRAKVNAAQADLLLISTESINSDDIQKLGLKLKASYLIFGRLHDNSGLESITDPEKMKMLNISFRIVSVLNSETIGVINYSTSYKGNVNNIIEEMMNKIVTEMVSR